MRIREMVAAEIDYQESINFAITSRPDVPDVPELFENDEHSRLYLPRVDNKYFPHTVQADDEMGLLEIFNSVEALCGGRYGNKYAIVTHESIHAKAAKLLGQQSVRFVVRIEAQPKLMFRGQQTRTVSLTPSAILEDLWTTRLGVALFQAAPYDLSEGDRTAIQSLGYATADEVFKRANTYNETSPVNHYPLLR